MAGAAFLFAITLAFVARAEEGVAGSCSSDNAGDETCHYDGSALLQKGVKTHKNLDAGSMCGAFQAGFNIGWTGREDVAQGFWTPEACCARCTSRADACGYVHMDDGHCYCKYSASGTCKGNLIEGGGTGHVVGAGLIISSSPTCGAFQAGFNIGWTGREDVARGFWTPEACCARCTSRADACGYVHMGDANGHCYCKYTTKSGTCQGNNLIKSGFSGGGGLVISSPTCGAFKAGFNIGWTGREDVAQGFWTPEACCARCTSRADACGYVHMGDANGHCYCKYTTEGHTTCQGHLIENSGTNGLSGAGLIGFA